MPELPEVETVRQTLRRNILGKKIKDVKVFYERIIQNQNKDDFISSLKDKTLIEINRLGKYLIFEFSDDLFMISHLRMEGKYFIKPITDEVVKHEHVVFQFTDGTSLRFHDVRKFGTMQLKDKSSVYTTHPLINLGMEATLLTKEYLYELGNKKHRDLKAFLLDQSIIAGIGNIYADEICYLANLHPKQDIYYLSLADYERLAESSKKVMEKAILAGGTTIRSYTSSLGVTGLFQLELNVHTKANTPCPNCNNLIVKTRVAGRGTYICLNCQKIKD